MTGPVQEKWHQSLPLLGVLFVIVGPLALPVLWVNRKIRLPVKVLVTLLVIGLSYYMLILTRDLSVRVDDVWEQTKTSL